jgi:hypothetical protein
MFGFVRLRENSDNSKDYYRTIIKSICGLKYDFYFLECKNCQYLNEQRNFEGKVFWNIDLVPKILPSPLFLTIRQSFSFFCK